MIKIGILSAVTDFIRNVAEKIKNWRLKREYIEQNSEYIAQIERMDVRYHPEKPDVEVGLKCKEYLLELFPAGIKEKVYNMSPEELLEFFQKIEKDAEQILDVQIDIVDYYATNEQPECGYCGFYNHMDNSFHINAAFILSGEPELIEEQVYTIFHELKHARQWAAIEGKLKGNKDYGYSDEQIRTWAENLKHYIPTFVSDEMYRKQPIEMDAYGFESIIKGERQFEVI